MTNAESISDDFLRMKQCYEDFSNAREAFSPYAKQAVPLFFLDGEWPLRWHGTAFDMLWADILGELGFEAAKDTVELLILTSIKHSPPTKPAKEALLDFGPPVLDKLLEHIDRFFAEGDSVTIWGLMCGVILPIVVYDDRITEEQRELILREEIIPRIRRFSQADNADMRDIAAGMAGIIGLPVGAHAKTILHNLLDDEIEFVRESAAYALRKLGE